LAESTVAGILRRQLELAFENNIALVRICLDLSALAITHSAAALDLEIESAVLRRKRSIDRRRRAFRCRAMNWI
jgi:hypothetical protein